MKVLRARGPLKLYPNALERGLCSERELKPAMAVMYINGVFTRKVNEVLKELCGLEVSTTRVSRPTGLLDEEL